MRLFLFLLFISTLILGCGDNSASEETSSSDGSSYSSSLENSPGEGNSSSSNYALSSGAGGALSSGAGSALSSGAGSASSPSGNVSSSSSQAPINPGEYEKLTSANAYEGYGTRYWDGCKPSCSWPNNVNNNLSNICKNCDINNQESPAYYWHEEWNQYQGTTSSCDQGGIAYTCFDMAPIVVNDSISYGFVATAGSEGNVCGKCFQLQFDGKGKYDTKETHALLNGKTMIVMASNIGYDVGSGHFDILIPGGGLGAFDSFSKQLGVSENDLGARYGGFLTTCNETLSWESTVEQYKSCVMQKCKDVFGGNSKFSELLRGCEWFVDWFQAADNPTFLYKEVNCPDYLVQKYRSTN